MTMSVNDLIYFDFERYSKNKKRIAITNSYYMLDRTQSMFRWGDLPETVPEKWLELQLQCGGCSFFTKVNDKFYTFNGGLGGKPDPYYQPTIFTVSNPALNYSKNLKIGVDGVLISNDTLRVGLKPLIAGYTSLLAENRITIRIATIMKRITDVFSGSDESTIESIREYLRQIEDGKLGVIQENPFLDDVKVQNGATENTSRLTDLIELEQFLKASMYNELGLQANYNMKRESINSQEAQLGDDALQPLVDNMLKCRKEAAEAINKMYGLDISVDFNGAWFDNEVERKELIKSINGGNEADETEGSIRNSGDVINMEIEQN